MVNLSSVSEKVQKTTGKFQDIKCNLPVKYLSDNVPAPHQKSF